MPEVGSEGLLKTIARKIFGRGVQTGSVVSVQPTRATDIEPPTPRTLLEVGADILLRDKSLSQQLRNALFQSLENRARYMENEGGSWFISATEARFFEDVLTESKQRPLHVINLASETNPHQTLTGLSELYKVKGDQSEQVASQVPVVIIKGFDEVLLDKLDPDWIFDNDLRSHVQHDGWTVLLQGRARYGTNSCISGSSHATDLAVAEWHLQKTSQ